MCVGLGNKSDAFRMGNRMLQALVCTVCLNGAASFGEWSERVNERMAAFTCPRAAAVDTQLSVAKGVEW